MSAVLRKCRACGLPVEAAEDECNVCFGSPGHWCALHGCWVEAGGCRLCAPPPARRVPPPAGRRWCPVHRRLTQGGVCPDCVAAMDAAPPPQLEPPAARVAARVAKMGKPVDPAPARPALAKARRQATAGEAFLIAAMLTVLLWNAVYLAAWVAWVFGWLVGSAGAAFEATRALLLWGLTLLAVAAASRPTMDLPGWGVFLIRLPFAALALMIVGSFVPGYWGGLLVMASAMSLTEAFFAYGARAGG